MTAAVTRRAALSSLAIAVTVPATIGFATPLKAVPAGCAAWYAKKDEIDRLRCEADALSPLVDRIEAAWYRLSAKVPVQTLPTSNGPVRTDNHFTIASIRSGCARIRYLEECAYDDQRNNYAFLKAVDEREDRLQRIDRRIGRNAINARYDAMWDRISDLEIALCAIPAPDGPALLWKVEKLYTPGDGNWSDGIEDQTYADLERFLGGEA